MVIGGWLGGPNWDWNHQPVSQKSTVQSQMPSTPHRIWVNIRSDEVFNNVTPSLVSASWNTTFVSKEWAIDYFHWNKSKMTLHKRTISGNYAAFTHTQISNRPPLTLQLGCDSRCIEFAHQLFHRHSGHIRVVRLNERIRTGLSRAQRNGAHRRNGARGWPDSNGRCWDPYGDNDGGLGRHAPLRRWSDQVTGRLQRQRLLPEQLQLTCGDVLGTLSGSERGVIQIDCFHLLTSLHPL